MSIRSESALAKAYGLIEAGSIRQAEELLEEVFPYDLENDALNVVISYCMHWMETFDRLPQLEPFEQGESLVNQWKGFKIFLNRKDQNVVEQAVYAFRKGVFTTALDQYSRVYDEKDQRTHAEVCRKIGLCCKKLGSYEKALAYLVEANNTMQGQANILAEMADCYDLCGENKLAKVIFREAFFIAPEKTELDFLDSPLINELIERVREKGYGGMELQEWLPVYGTLLGLLNVRRTLKSQEVIRLKQDIYAKENELKDPANNAALITPRLLNMYFWLIDYYDLSHDSGARIHEVLLKIKILDRDIYAQYTG
ncbi:MAG TPA: hypothetical protein DDW78_03050 [Treponema sp.]|nr:hypothetical protein [Treponema sp.]